MSFDPSKVNYKPNKSNPGSKSYNHTVLNSEIHDFEHNGKPMGVSRTEESHKVPDPGRGIHRPHTMTHHYSIYSKGSEHPDLIGVITHHLASRDVRAGHRGPGQIIGRDHTHLGNFGSVKDATSAILKKEDETNRD